jgi:putative transcriptional regulator
LHDLRGEISWLYSDRVCVNCARSGNGHRETGRQARVTRETINALEKGRFHPNLRLAFKIARAFGEQIAEVFICEDI